VAEKFIKAIEKPKYNVKPGDLNVDMHSLSEALSSCVSRKRRWEFDGDEKDDIKPAKEVKRGDEQDTP
jgi:hypothetical protein